ncbi:MAG: galactokinase family protein [Gemmatimonadota bacterium]
MTSWSDGVAAIGLSPAAAEIAGRHFREVSAHHAAQFGTSTPTRAWWIPGRIEVLGKHTDYGGGRSLLCAVERGFHVVASPRSDKVVHIADASTSASVTIPLDRDAPTRPGHWTDYPITVVRRVARDFPEATTGMNAVIRSSLPSAAGLSSSSALVIACFLPLAALNNLRQLPAWSAIRDEDSLAEYLGAMENGRAYGALAADRGVGTQGGCEDQTAIIRSQPGTLLQYHFIPVTREGTVPLPAGWRFAIGMSGVHAAKGAAVKERYNALAQEVAALLALWNSGTGRHDRSLFAALQGEPDAAARLAAMIAADSSLDNALQARLAQFVDETDVIIPQVAGYLRDGNVAAVGDLVARSQANAEGALRNQIPETIHLARRARELGAAAGSAFGAGFGGSVWALVRDEDLAPFMARWRDDYLATFPARRQRAEFFASRPGPAAGELPPDR